MKSPRISSIACTVPMLLLLLTTASLGMAPPPGASSLAERDVVPGEILIQLTVEAHRSPAFQSEMGAIGRTGLTQLDGLLASLGAFEVNPVFDLSVEAEAKNEAGLDRIFLVRYSANLDPQDAAQTLSGQADLAYAEPNHIARAMLTPNDPTYPLQWAHNNTSQAIRYGGGNVGTPDCDTDTDQAWDLQTGSSTLIVAIVDTGVDTGHPEFAGRVVAGYDYVNNDSSPLDDNGHGTSCAGIALGAGNNSQGIAGVAWGVKLMALKVLDSGGSGSYTWVANGITFAADNGAKILSLSLGGPASGTLQTAVNYAVNTRGCAMFCATGNANASSLDYPAAYSNTIAVGALSPCNERKNPSSCDGEYWWGSNYGTGIEFLAPGTRIHTTDIRGSGGFGSGDYIPDFNGTSSATPHAAGIGALVWSQNPALTNTGLQGVLQSNCDDLGTAGYDTQTGYGRLNAFRAVQNAGGGGGGGDPVTIFSENFEINVVPGSVWSASDANSGNGSDYWGDQSSSGGARVHGGSWSAYCADHSSVPGQSYDNYMNANMTLINAVPVSGYTGVTFSFWLWYYTYNSNDYVSFQYWSGTSWVEQQRWSGGPAGWLNPSYNLTGFTTFRFRFIFFSNSVNTREGAYVDDIVLSGVPGSVQPGPMAVRLISERSEEPSSSLGGGTARYGLASDRVLSAAPNPFGPETALRFTLTTPADVRLDIFSADGRRVATVHDGILASGPQALSWLGLDQAGGRAPSGIYYARLSVDDHATATERLVLLRK